MQAPKYLWKQQQPKTQPQPNPTKPTPKNQPTNPPRNSLKLLTLVPKIIKETTRRRQWDDIWGQNLPARYNSALDHEGWQLYIKSPEWILADKHKVKKKC